MATPETKLKNKCLDWIQSKLCSKYPEVCFFRRNPGPGYLNGLPDVYGFVGPLHFEIEFKREDGKGSLSSQQHFWLHKFQKIGVPYIVADSLDDVKKFFENNFGLVE